MMKHIVIQGEGLVKPFENNYVSINYKIYLNNQLFKEALDHTEYLNSENFTEGEITIIKSMKKNELSKIHILRDYFLEEFLNRSKLFTKNEFDFFLEKLNNTTNKTNSTTIKGKDYTDRDIPQDKDQFNIEADNILTHFENNKEEEEEEEQQNCGAKASYEAEKQHLRITYEIELVKLKNNKSFNSYKNTIAYEKTTLCKGIGNICPWNRSSIKFLMKLKVNQKEIYCDDFRELKISEIQFCRRIKDIKKIIKTKKDYLYNIQFLIDNLIKENLLIDTSIYDPLKGNLPDLIFEILKTMRILQVENLKFTLESAKAKNEFLNLLSINRKETNTNTNTNTNIQIDFAASDEFKNKDLTFDVTLCLLNFQENFSIFNKNIILLDNKAKIAKLLEYKGEANFYFGKALMKKAKKINKFLVTEYTKYINVDNSYKTSDLLVRNQDDFVKPKLKFDFLLRKTEKNAEITEANELIGINPNNTDNEDLLFEGKFYFEMKKVFSNLILIYFKLEKLKKCQEYIELFMHVFTHELVIEIENNNNHCFYNSNNANNHSVDCKGKGCFFVDEVYEKVLFLEFRLKMKLSDYKLAEAIIIKMISLYHVDFDLKKPLVFEQEVNLIAEIKNKENVVIRYDNYMKEYNVLKEKILKTDNDKTNMFKRMFKN